MQYDAQAVEAEGVCDRHLEAPLLHAWSDRIPRGPAAALFERPRHLHRLEVGCGMAVGQRANLDGIEVRAFDGVTVGRGRHAQLQQLERMPVGLDWRERPDREWRTQAAPLASTVDGDAHDVRVRLLQTDEAEARLHRRACKLHLRRIRLSPGAWRAGRKVDSELDFFKAHRAGSPPP